MDGVDDRQQVDEVDRLLPGQSKPEGKHEASTGRHVLGPASDVPPRLRQVLFFVTYIFYYAANTLMGPLLPSSKKLKRAATVSSLVQLAIFCLHHLLNPLRLTVGNAVAQSSPRCCSAQGQRQLSRQCLA